MKNYHKIFSTKLIMNISNYNSNKDWLPIIASTILLESLLILNFRYFSFWGKDINIWYNKFGLSAVIADVLIILIGFAIVRYIYTYFKLKWNPFLFLAIFLGVQKLHDILFYLFIINPIKGGVNSIMDFMKLYAKNVGYKGILGDSLMVILIVLAALFLSDKPTHVNISVLLIGLYMLPYVLTTRERF